jgi:hypothetical protein
MRNLKTGCLTTIASIILYRVVMSCNYIKKEQIEAVMAQSV